MKRPPDPPPPLSSFLTFPIYFRFLVYSSRSGVTDSVSPQISTLGPFACHHLAMLCRNLRFTVGLGFEYVPIHYGVPRSDRVWPQLTLNWKSLVSTVQGHLLYVHTHDDLLHSVWPQICMVVGVILQCSTRYHLSLLSIFHEFQ